MRWRAPAVSGTLTGDPEYSRPGAIDAALTAASIRYQPRRDFADADAVREGGVALRILVRLRVVFVAVCAPAYLVGGIGAAYHAPMALWLTGMLVSATSMTGTGFAALLASREPLRWVPRLHGTAVVFCLFGGILAAVLLGSGLASGSMTGGGRLTPAIGLAFLPATMMGVGGMVVHVSRRRYPRFRAMRGGSR
jgi:hypothetical protein